MSIISISGKMGSGKDTAGKIIQWLTSESMLSYNDYFSSTKDGIRFNLPESELYKSKWQIKKWATPLRKIGAILLGMDEAFLHTDEFKKMVLPECWNYPVEISYTGRKLPEPYWCQMDGRQFLQNLGTNAIRNGLHKQSWMNATMSEYKSVFGKLPNWIMTDTRFFEELSAVKKVGGITIRINRTAATVAAGTHESETALDNASFDHEVNNDGTIEELTEKLLPIILKLN